MARIALIVKKISPEVLALATSLTGQKNEISFISSKEIEIPEGFEFPIITPFQKWSLAETLELFPKLLSNLPDVLHFVFTEKNQQPTRADWLLSRIFRSIPRRVVAASFFYSPRQISSWRLRKFLRTCHAVTWGSHVHLLQAKRDRIVSAKSLVEVIPPILERPDQGKVTIAPDLQRLILSLNPYFVVPGSSEEFFAHAKAEELFFDQKINFLFLSERKSTFSANNCFYLNSEYSADIFFAIEHSKAILLAFNDYSLLELQSFYQWSRWGCAPLIVRPDQNQIFSGLVLDKKTGWIIDQDASSLRNLVRDFPDFRLPHRLDEHPGFQLVDSATNSLSRLFSQALSLRS